MKKNRFEAWVYASFGMLLVFLFYPVFFEGKAFVGATDRFVIEVPSLAAFAREWQTGHFPFWNSFMFSGRPFVGDQLIRPIYPLNLLIAKFWPSHIPWATSLRLIAEMFLMLAGGYVFWRRFWQDRVLSLISTFILCFSIASVENFNHGDPAPFVYFPWLLYFFFEPEKNWPAAVLGGGFAMAFQVSGGLYQPAAYLIGFSFIFSVFYSSGWDKKILIRRSAIFCAAGALALLLNMREILPFLEMQAGSNRSFISYPEALARWGQPWYMAWRVLLPFFLGNYSQFPRIETGTDSGPYEAFCAYAGVATFFLAVLTLWRLREPAFRLWWAGLLVTSLAALKTPLFALPYYFFGRSPLMHGRIAFLFPVFMAFLAPAGLKTFLLLDAKRQKWSLGIILIVSVLAFAFASGMFGPGFSMAGFLPLHTFWSPPEAPPYEVRFREAAGIFLVFSLSFALLLFLRISNVFKDGIFKTACLVLVAADLIFITWAYSLRRVFAHERDWYPSSPPIEFLKNSEDREFYRTNIELGVQWNESPVRAGRFRFNIHMPHQIMEINGYSQTIDARYADLISHGRGAYRTAPMYPVSTSQMADLLAVKYLVVPDTQESWHVYSPFTDIALRWKDTLVLVKKNPLPRFRLACQAFEAGTLEQTLDLAHSGIPLDRSILVEPGTPFQYSWKSCPKGFKGRLQMLEMRSGYFKAQVENPDPVLFLAAEIFSPAWKASVNGRPVPILRANYAFQAVELPAGNSLVEFQAQSARSFLGGVFTVCGFLASVCLGFAVWKRRLRI